MNPSPQTRRAAWAGLGWMLVAVIAGFAFIQGLHLRKWIYDVTEPIHFTSDIQRGCFWGLEASGPEGYLNQYEKMSLEKPDWQDYRWSIWLDYAPLRLLVMSRWGAWLRSHDRVPAGASLPDAWQRDYAYTAPVLHFNTAMDVLGAACAFLLTRLWVIKGSADQPPHPMRGVWQGLAAALLLWFNPTMLISAYGWPTWDCWIVPMYLLAALLASVDWWFCAGLALGVGAMFKGQQLAVAIIFVIWPLLQGRVGAALRWCSGLLFGFALLASPWLVSYLDPQALAAARQIQSDLPVAAYPEKLFVIPRYVDGPALLWIGGLLVAAALLPWLARRITRRPEPGASWSVWLLHARWQVLGLAAIAVAMAVMWPWMLQRNHLIRWQGAAAGLALAIAALAFRPRHQPYVLAAATGAALLLCINAFHGSTAWWNCAFHYGTIHWPWLMVGRTSNVPALLQERFDWAGNDINAVALTMNNTDITIKQLCNGTFIVLLLIAGIGVGLQARRNDKRMLAALVTPWLMFFLFPVQIHERYLLFAAAVSVICMGLNVGLVLLGLLLSVASSIMTLHIMVENGDRGHLGEILAAQFPSLFSTSAGDTLFRYIIGTHPDIAWGVLLAAGVFMYVSLTKTQRAR